MTASPDGGQAQGARTRELAAVLDAISDYAIITLDADGRVVNWNHNSQASAAEHPASPLFRSSAGGHGERGTNVRSGPPRRGAFRPPSRDLVPLADALAVTILPVCIPAARL